MRVFRGPLYDIDIGCYFLFNSCMLHFSDKCFSNIKSSFAKLFSLRNNKILCQATYFFSKTAILQLLFFHHYNIRAVISS